MPVPSPIKRSITRIKRPESVVDKILRKTIFISGMVFQPKASRQWAIHWGQESLCIFFPTSQWSTMHCASEVLEISSADPPVAYLSRELWERFGLKNVRLEKKESGYASIHYVARLRTSVIPLADRPWFEIQVRTLVEDVWGDIEHILGYKPNKKTSVAVRKQFQIISSQLTAIDEHFNLPLRRVGSLQEEAKYRDLDPLNAENLPPVLSDLGISCAQREIDGLLKLLTSRGVKTVGELTESANQKRLSLIKGIFQEVEDRPPRTLRSLPLLGQLTTY